MQKTSKKIAMIMFGQSQTGKSSFINHVSKNYLCKVFNFNEGRSCTNEAACYGPFTSRTGHQILLIDTAGLNDSRPDKIDAIIKATLVEQIIKQFIIEITKFEPDKIVFVITESLKGDTIQFLKNLTHICDLFGKKSLICSILILTKYNLQPDKMQLKEQQTRIDVIQEENRKFCQNIQISTIPTCPFYTQIINNDQIDTDLSIIDETQLLPQEQQLFQFLEQIPSYPIEIITEYKKFCEEMIIKLQLEDGVGVKRIEKVRIKWVEEQRQVTEWVPKNQSFGQKLIASIPIIGGLFSGGNNFKQVTRTQNIKVPHEEKYTEDVQIKNHDDVVKLFMEDVKYKEIRMKKLDELMGI